MKYTHYEREPVYEDEIKNDPLFWSFFLHYAFCQKQSMDICQKIVNFAEQHYPLDETWIEEFTRPKTDPEKMTEPKEKYVRNLAYFPGGSSFNIHFIRFYQDKIVYSGAFTMEDAKKESVSRMSFKTYKKAVMKCGPLSGILLIPMVYIKNEEMPEFQNMIRIGLMETAFSPADYDALESLIMAYCRASEEEMLNHKLSFIGKYWSAGAVILFIATMWFISRHNYSYVGESGLYRTMVDSFSYIPIYLYFFGGIYAGVLYVLFVVVKPEEKDRKKYIKKRMAVTVISTVLFLYILGSVISVGVRAIMDARNLNRQMAKVYAEMGYDRAKPWTWEGLEVITLENPKVNISRYHGRYSGTKTYYTISASNISRSFKIPANTSAAERLQKHIDNGETLIVYYYKHSRVVERICNEEYDILMGNTIYYLPESLDIPHY